MHDVLCVSNGRGNERSEDVVAVKFLRLRPEAKRSDLIRVHNDTVMKLEAQIYGLEKEIKNLKDKIAELGTEGSAEEEV